MKEISFYQLTSSNMESALPKLLEKVYNSGKRAVLIAENDDKMEEYNRLLWTYHPHRFLPHGTKKDGNLEQQIVYLTTQSAIENPNGAEILVITGGLEPDFKSFARVLDIFDGNNEESLKKARGRWKKYQDMNHSLSYFQQDKTGKWEKSA